MSEPIAQRSRRSTGRSAVLQLVTLGRVPIAAAFAAILIYWSGLSATLLCLLLLILIEISDCLDGYLARRWGLVSEWGAMIDPYSDSISRITVYWALAVSGLAWAVLPLVMAARDITVAYCRVILTRHGQSVSARWSGKLKACVQATGAFLLLLSPLYTNWTGEWPIPAVSCIVLIATLVSPIEYAAAAISAANSTDS
jgi:CDP-diacylglycerol--glycerol-3-phosphate 3-phosphatidyltransferase